ncbi:MAG: hypothetical protein FWC81_02570 [Coriobacteriia bacterium]|nr:hypothetical protein [Coriobacteriia bacterium]MCL2606516.1 hypothetical protein [Coriobacteriia bacterium]
MSAKKNNALQRNTSRGKTNTEYEDTAMMRPGSEQLYRRIFILVLLAMVATVFLGLGPVWLSAEATRASQHAQLLRAEIAENIAISEDLEMQRAALGTSIRLDPDILQDLGLGRDTEERSFVELGVDDSTAMTVLSPSYDMDAGHDSIIQLASLSQGDMQEDTYVSRAEPTGIDIAGTIQEMFDTVTRLTAGEASTLLVGDLGSVAR